VHVPNWDLSAEQLAQFLIDVLTARLVGNTKIDE
jgi:hypothetical protein